MDRRKLEEWLYAFLKEGEENHPEVERFIDNLLIEIEFGRFEPDGEEDEVNPYEFV